MNLRTRRTFFLGILLFVFFWSGSTAALWPPRAEGIEPDPAWRWGVLENGLRYVIRHNAAPLGHISFRLNVEVGAAHESKAERGLAHFVEHMAFNGTKHFPGETLIPELARHGVGIGPEISAFTMLTNTIYYLDAPSVAPADLNRWFTVLRDFADGILFDARQVKRERGVIASETRDRESPGARAEAARRSFFFFSSPLSNPLGGTVEKFDRAALRRFYDKWYRPERMILAVVGDADPAVLEALVRQHFSTMRPRTFPAPTFDPGLIANPSHTETAVYHDPKAGSLNVEVTSLLPRRESDTLAERRRWLARNLLLYMFNVRLGEVVRAHPTQLRQLEARSTLATPYHVETSVGFSAPPQDWYFALTTMEKELRRSLNYTFAGDEIREARTAILAAAELRLKTSATELSTSLAGHVVQQALWGFVSSSPADDLKRTRDWLQEITALEISHAWRDLWQAGRAQIFAHGFFPVPNGHALIADTFQQSLREPIEAPTPKRELTFAYTEFGSPGKIKRREYLADLDLHLLEFENGVRANLKRTNFEAATVHLTANFGNGMLAEPGDQPGLGALVSGSFLNGALGQHNPEQLRRILSASAIALTFNCNESEFAFSGHATPTSLDLLLRVVCAYATDPAWNEASAGLAKAQLSSYAHDLNFTPEGRITQRVFRFLANDDQRYAPPTALQVADRTVEEMKHWMDKPLRSAPIEVGLVGDFDPETAIEILSRTLGALPARAASQTSVPPIKMTKTASTHRFTYRGEANRDVVEVVWPMNNCDQVTISRQTEVLGAILENRLRQKIREDLGATYALSVSYWKSEASPRDGYLIAYLSAQPGQANRLAKLITTIADQVGRKGVTPDEFVRGREPVLARSVADQKQNTYWVRHIASKAQSHPEVRQWPLTRVSDLQAMTADEINALARTVLPASQAIVFTAVPEQP